MDTVVYRTIREQIAHRLRNEVLAGRFSQGEPLREAKLAKRFGVSRGPIRDALLQLTQEGLLTGQPNVGVKVSQSPSEAIRPLVVELRKQIEGYALAAIFNSTVFEALVLARTERAKDSHFRYFGSTIARTPVPPLDREPALVERLVRLSRRAHRGSDVSSEIDRAVTELYGLSDSELRLLSQHADRLLGRDAR